MPSPRPLLRADRPETKIQWSRRHADTSSRDGRYSTFSSDIKWMTNERTMLISGAKKRLRGREFKALKNRNPNSLGQVPPGNDGCFCACPVTNSSGDGRSPSSGDGRTVYHRKLLAVLAHRWLHRVARTAASASTSMSAPEVPILRRPGALDNARGAMASSPVIGFHR